MSTILENSITSSRLEPVASEDVLGQIARAAGALPQISLRYEEKIKTLWLTIRPEPKPVFTYDLLKSITSVQRAIRRLWGSEEAYNTSPLRYLAYRADGPIFSLGGDLDFYLDCLRNADRLAFEEYAEVVIEAVNSNASGVDGSLITLAAVQGNTFGGGIDAPCSCNFVVAAEQAIFAYPEVKFNHAPITATSIMSRRVGDREAHKMLAYGREYSAAQFEALGAVDAVVPKGDADEAVRRFASDTLPMHAARLALNVAFYRRGGDLDAELRPLAKLWVDSMMRLSPMQISRLQRLAIAQERMLQLIYAEKPADAS
jgi:DSF synthase